MERLKLTITNIAEPKPVGDKGAVKLSFKAKTPDGKDLQYFTFTKRLFDMIKPEAAIEGDVDISQREVEGNTYIDRKLMEIYIDGKPTGQAKRAWQPADDSPEKRASIEAQKAAEIFGEWVANKVIPLDHPLAQAVIKWGYAKLGVQPSSVKTEPTKPPASPPSAKAPGAQKVQDDAVKVRQAPPASKPVPRTKSLPAGLEEDIKTLATKVTGYQRENLIPYLDELSGNLGSESITSAYNKLTEEQQVEFTAQVAEDIKLV